MQIGNLQLGRVDGKYEFVGKSGTKEHFFDAFFLPRNISLEKLASGEIFFINGFRGTGKTSLLRYFVFTQPIHEQNRKLILFKSGLSEEEKLEISSQIGIQWEEVDSSKMEVSQNFKQAWIWRIFHEIGEILKDRPEIAKGDPEHFLTILGLEGTNPYDKILGFLPRIKGANVQIKANVGFFEATLGTELRKGDSEVKVSLLALNKALMKSIIECQIDERIVIAFDELEAFFDTEERYKRDLRMVRDIIFAITELNEFFRRNAVPIYSYAAIRTEILDAMRVVGHEVEREAHDFGVTLSWHNESRSLQHPLLNLIRRKIASNFNEVDESADLLLKFFPEIVKGESLDKYLLDESFYKPRDLIWRLTIAQKNFPTKARFDQEVLTRTEAAYSSQLWKEVEYELSAAYSSEEIGAVALFFSGIPQYFSMEDLEKRLHILKAKSMRLNKMFARRSLADVLNDMYRLGAIGNAFRVGPRAKDIRNQWIFRGDNDLLLERRMQLHPALIHRLSGIKGRGVEW